MANENEASEAHISIGAAARAASLRPDVVRAWERRYGALTPTRTESGRRRYTHEQVDRLCLLADATRGGHPISAVACLSVEELRRLLDASRAAERPRPATGAESSADDLRDPLDGAIDAIRAFDAPALRSVLERGLARVGSERLIEDLIAPLLHGVGVAWERGDLSEAHEHFVSAIVRTFLGGLTTAIPDAPAAPVVVVATPEGERHELGALLAAWAAVLEGWRAVYLGPDLPAPALGAAVRATGAEAVALSITCGASDAALAAIAETLEGLSDVTVWVGGVARSRLVSHGIGFESLAGIPELRRRLGERADEPAV